ENDTDPDGGALTLVSVTEPGHGTAVLAAGNKVRYTPNTGYYGTDTFDYTVRDSAGNTKTATVTVNVGNAPPVAEPDSAATKVGESVDIDVLANDTDPNTDQTLELTGAGAPEHGTTEVLDAKVRYTPEDGWTGTDTFVYEVSDGVGGTAEGTVTVTVTEDGNPVAVADERRTPYQKKITIAVLENDLDPDGTLALDVVGTPDHGTATASGDKVVYTPPTGFSGLATFTYTVKNAAGQTSGSTVKVTVAPAPIAPDKNVEAQPGTAVSIPMPTVDKNGTKITIKSVGTPKHGTAKLNADGTVTYKAAKGFSGTDTFEYTAMDADGNETKGVVTVAVAGASQPPVAVKDRYTAKKGSTITFKPLKNDTDPNGGKLTILKIGKPKHGTATLAGNTVTYAAAAGYTGTDTMSYTIQNENGDTARATIAIRVTASGGGSGDNGDGDLPTTGSSIAPVFTMGMLTMLVGGWMLLLSQVSQPGRHRPGRHRD
ncbi:MAG TPA: Ig-like domain-containing protein, partial [Actinoplanes sp.]|nr:Ig-like domain-containing protein [Actinoplanes sp.]